MTRIPTLGVVRLRRLVSSGAGRKRVGRSEILEHGISPSAAVREPLAILYHEIHVMQGVRHCRHGELCTLFRIPMDLRHLGAVGEGLAVAWNARLVSLDH